MKKRTLTLILGTTIITTLSQFFLIESAQALVIVNLEGNNTFSVVNIPVNGIDTGFIIDLNSEKSIVDVKTAFLAGLIDTGLTFPLDSIGDFTAPIKSGSVIVGKELPLEFAVTDSINLPAGVSGILGLDFLEKTDSIIDLNNKILSADPDFPLIFLGGRTFVDIPTKGNGDPITLRYEVDSAAGITIIAPADATRLGLTDTGIKVNLGGAYSGIKPLKKGNLDDLGMLDFVVSDPNPDNPNPAGVTGVLGKDVLDETAIINLKEKKLTLEPIPGGGGGNKQVVPIKLVTTIRVPEPTSTLSLLALGTLGATSTLKRKLKSSKSSEKETTKVS